MGSSHPLANMTFSASRIQTWMNCNRKAGWQYICGYEDPGSDATDFGTEVHAELENVKRTPGYLPNALTHVGAVALEALPHVEDFRLEDGASCEGQFTFRGPKHRWTGFIDLRKPGKINDYKTTSDFKWAKTPEELLVDPQALLYAAYEFTRWDGPTVDLQWLYLHKRKRAAKPVIATVTRAYAQRGFAALESIADDMQAAAIAAPAPVELRHRYVLDVLQPNTDHCSAYGGCPHRARCNLPFFSEPKKGTKPVGLLEDLLKQDTFSPPGNATQAVAAVAPAPAFEPSIEIPTDAAGPATEPVLPVAAPAEGINPPKRGPGRPRGSKNKTKAEEASPTVAPSPTGSGMTVVAPVTEQPALSPAQAIASAATEIQPPETHTPPTTGVHRIDTLYIGCIPRGADEAEIVDFDMLIARAKVGIGPQDWRLFEYGKGNGLLLQMFEGIVQQDKPANVVLVDPRSPEAVLCLSYLRGVSDTVVEAVAR